MKYTSKTQLIELCQTHWDKVWTDIDDLDASQLTRRSQPDSRTLAWSIKDAMAHVHAWHRLTLGWIKAGKSARPHLPAEGYKWNQTRELNESFYHEFRDVELASISRRLKLSHGRIMKCIGTLSESDLLKPGSFVWTGKLPITSYVGPNTVGHYRWLRKKIKTLK
jgi:hypothetical protein